MYPPSSPSARLPLPVPFSAQTGLGSLLHPTRLFQSDYHSISVRASATFSDAVDVDSDAAITSAPPGSTAGGGGGGVITSLTLEQTVLAVFRPRPLLPSAVSPNKQRGLGSSSSSSSKSRSGASDGAGDTADGVAIKVIPEGEGWSVSSLLMPLKSALSDTERAEMLQLGGCPVAARSAIHVVDGKAIGEVLETSASEGCAASGAGCDPGPAAGNVVTRLLLPVGAESGAIAENQEATPSAPSSVSEFLQEKLWDVGFGDGTAEGDDALAATLASSTTPAVARLDHYLSGRGGTRGVSVANLVNMNPTSGAFVDFLQPVPYFMEPLLGTLRARLTPSSLGSPPALPRVESAAAGPLVSLARNVTLTPGEGRRPAVVEARLWVPAASTVVLGFDFFKRFLTVDDFPPDPSRGFDVPPPLARFSFAGPRVEGSVGGATCERPGGGDGADRVRGVCGQEHEGEGDRVVYAYGEAGLMDTPQPDFSMPFNVITFTSTVITFFLGTAINLLVRKSRKKATKKKGGVAEASGKDCDGSEQPGDRSGGRVDGRHRWFGGLRGTLSGAFSGLFGRKGRGQTGTGRRIQKEVSRLKGD